MEIKWINEINACTIRCIFGIQMKLFLLQAMSFQNPIARWRFQRCDESFTGGATGFGDPGWLDTSLANVNVEARKRTLLGHDWNLAATASVRFHVQVYLCAISHWEKPWHFRKWTKLGGLMRFVCCLFLFAPSWASKVRLVWWLTKISEIARMRHRLPDLKVRASFSHRGHTTTSSSKRCSHWAMCSFPLTNRNRTYRMNRMKLSHEPSLWLGRTWMKSPVTSPRCILFLCCSELKYSSHWNYEVHQLQMDLKPSWSCSGDKYHL